VKYRDGLGDDMGVEYLGRELGKSISHIIKLTEKGSHILTNSLSMDPSLLVGRLLEMKNNVSTFWAFMDTLW